MDKLNNHQQENLHQKEDKSKLILKCEECNKEFDTLANLKIHEGSHASTDNQRQDLEMLKNEILKEVKPGKNKKRLHWGSVAITVVLMLLTLVSITQAVQSANILDKIENGAIKPASTGNSENALPSSLQDLPDMVGGC